MYVLGPKNLVIQWNKVRAEITVRSWVPAGPWDQGLGTWIVMGLAPLRSAHQRVEGGEKVLPGSAQAGEPNAWGKGG